MSRRPSQLALGLDPGAKLQSWQDGAPLPCLGRTLVLRLTGMAAEAVRIDDELHLPLPPAAGERQVRDAGEAWLRREAWTLFAQTIMRLSAAAARPAPALRLSFARRGHWTTTTDDGALQCNWRLVEQPPDVIEQVISRALRSHWARPVFAAAPDLFAIQ